MVDLPRLCFSRGSGDAPATVLTKNNYFTPPFVNKPKANQTNTKAKKQTMKFIQMITAALAGTIADWDYNWGGSLSSLLFFKNTKNTKIMFPSLQWEIAEMLTAPPSIFVPGYTVLDSPSPLLFIVIDDDVASFDLTTINSPFLKDLHASISFGELCLRRVVRVPSAGEFLEIKTQTQEGIAAQVKKWNGVKTVAAQSVRRWTMEFLKAHTSILPRYVWNLTTMSETIWQWRFVLQALTLVVRLTAASTTPWMALVLVPKVVLATLRAFDVSQKLFAAAFPQIAAAYRLFKMIYGFYKVYRFLRACWNAARNVRRIRSIRTVMAEAIRSLANWVMRRLAAVLWSLVREIFLWMAVLIGFYVLFLR
jgi:hypothetical protein